MTVSFGAATYTATEGGDPATVRVELDAAPGRAVEIPLVVTLLGTATAADYVAIPSSVTFGVEQTAATFTVTATVDPDADGDESVLIGFGRLPDGVVAGSPAAAAVTLADGTEQKLVVEFDTSWSHTVQVREGGRRKRLRVLPGHEHAAAADDPAGGDARGRRDGGGLRGAAGERDDRGGRERGALLRARAAG